MADVSMDNFLLQYFIQMRIKKMPPEIMAKYQEYLGKDDFRGHMKDWRNNLMHQVNGKWEAKPLPDPNGPDFHLADEEWIKLFKEFRSAFRTLAANKKKLEGLIDFGNKNDKALKFLEDYFGAGKLFNSTKARPDAKLEISKLRDVIVHNERFFRVFLTRNNLIDYDNLVSGITEKDGKYKYDSDPTLQKQLKDLVEYLDYYRTSTTELTSINFNGCDFDKISTGFEDDDTNLTSSNEFINFKNGEYDLILRRLYSEEKTRNAFPSDKIKTAFEHAKELTGYDDQNSKDYVPPKRDDELTPLQQLSKWADDTYADVFEKYTKFKGDRLYFSPQAKQIVDAIHKAEVKPTDGIKGVMDKAGDIEKKLLYKSPKATDHFKWFTKTMGELSNTMPKAFEGALRNGRQMHAIIEEMIMIAVRDGKVDEAKSAMEVLSVIKYGYTTSKIMDALGKENLSIFSDGNLSWNKNEGMKVVTTALDKSIKTAFMGIGYGITMVGNAINLSGSKFNGRRGRMMGKQQEWATQNATDKATAQTRRNTLNIQDQALIQQENQNKNAVNQNLQPGQRTITDANFQQQKTGLETARIAEDAKKTRLEQRAQDPAIVRYNNYHQLTQEQTSLNQNAVAIRQQIADLDTQIQQNQNIPGASQQEIDMRNQELIQAKIQYADQLTQIQQRLPDISNQLAQITNNPNWATDQQMGQQYEQELQDYNDTVNRNNAQKDRITKWENATKSIEEINERISKRDEVMDKWDDNHKDKYLELMAYWDMLETGRNTHMGKTYNWKPIKVGNAQKKFDGEKQTIISDYLSGYSYAA